jgi:hypothetical protein
MVMGILETIAVMPIGNSPPPLAINLHPGIWNGK